MYMGMVEENGEKEEEKLLTYTSHCCLASMDLPIDDFFSQHHTIQFHPLTSFH